MKLHSCSESIIHRIRWIMNCSSRYFCGIWMLFILVFLSVTSSAQAVGFKWIEKYDLRIGVWYPSPEPEKDMRLGPFDATLAVDAAPVPTGSFQVVLFSHGNLGRVRNHHLIAKALAEAGFVVVAPLHSADHRMAGENIATVLEWRVAELRFALEAVMQDKAFRSILDLSRIHALGYSLGGLTALNAAGAAIDVPGADAHCRSENDPAFCETPSWFLRWRVNRKRGTSAPSFPRHIGAVHFPLGFVTGGVATVAPVGQGFTVEPDSFSGRKLLVMGLSDDEVTRPEFHASNIAGIFADILETELVSLDAHHEAFISPFSKRVTDVEDIPAARDPEGFDRMKFLNEANGVLVNFFASAKRQF